MYFYSIIIPVYNRPNEVEDLLSSLTKQVFKQFEVIIVEDGSSVPCRDVVSRYEKELAIRYFVIPNGGPSGARNYGAAQSKGDYLLILDSDCVLPPTYTEVIDRYLTEDPLDAFGGPDRAHDSFTPIQKAISYSMTSFFTTGGIRGGKKKWIDSIREASIWGSRKRYTMHCMASIQQCDMAKTWILACELSKQAIRPA